MAAGSGHRARRKAAGWPCRQDDQSTAARGNLSPAFRYKHAGSLATIGKRLAVIDFGWIRLRGALAWWIWGLAHIYFLIGVRNRLSVALNWLWIYTRDQRSARLITQSGETSGQEVGGATREINEGP